jgi:hypothetical protein
MNNYLIITIGTRDVQLRKNLLETLPGWSMEPRKKGTFEVTAITKNGIEIEASYNKDFPDYFMCSPRISGQVIAKNLAMYEEVLDFPLIRPVLDDLWSKNVTISKVLLIYTDQQTGYDKKIVKSNNYNNDTIYFREIIQKTIYKHPLLTNAEFDDYVIWEQVANIDYQYDHFAEAHKDLLLGDPEQVKQIFLLPQGGIDQINQAITLQLIQAFKHKVKLLQKAEGTAVQELNFTSRFLNDLNKQKIIKHLEDYDFGMIDKNLHSNKNVYHLAQYASKRLNLLNNQNKVHLDILQKEGNYMYLDLVNSNYSKLIDYYLSSKISLKHQEFNTFLWKMYTLNENLFTIKIEEKLGNIGSYYNPIYGNNEENTKWVEKLEQTDSTLLSTLRKNKVWLNNPSRKASFILLPILFPEDKYLPIYVRLAEKLELLSKKRNSLAHGLGATDKNQINQLLGNDYSIDKLLNDLDQLFELESPFGIYDQIRQEIEELLEKPYA